MSRTKQALEVAQDAGLCNSCTDWLVRHYLTGYYKPISPSGFCDDCWVNWKVYITLLEAAAGERE